MIIRQNKHNTYLLLIIVILFIPLLMPSTSLSMIKVWSSDAAFNHGFLIFPISLWLIYEKRHELNSMSFKPSLLSILLLLPTLIIWLLATLIDVQVIQHLTLISIILLSVYSIFGLQVFSFLAFPLLYLFFAVPIGKGLVPPMMDITAHITVTLIKLTGIPIHRDGLFFTLPTGNWSVVEACSGVRYLIATTSLATLFAYLSYKSLKKRLIFILVAILVSIIGNGLRAFGIVMIGHFSNMEYGTSGDHTTYGWLFFGLIIFLLFYIGSFWSDISDGKKIAGKDLKTRAPTNFLMIPSVIIISIISTQLFSFNLINDKLFLATNTKIKIPDNFDDWRFINKIIYGWEPYIKKPTYKISKTYYSDKNLVQLNIGYFENQLQGSEAISSEHRITGLKDKLWKKANRKNTKFNDFDINQVELNNGSLKILTWSWYKIGDKETSNPYFAKAYSLINIFLKGKNDASLIIVATPITDDIKQSQLQLTSFLSKAHSKISDF